VPSLVVLFRPAWREREGAIVRRVTIHYRNALGAAMRHLHLRKTDEIQGADPIKMKKAH
jgi:hypothetical protein